LLQLVSDGRRARIATKDRSDLAACHPRHRTPGVYASGTEKRIDGAIDILQPMA
jgi:hypothetical protein